MISVVIPLFNKESCIRKTMDSVLTQSLKDFEVVVVDDGSTDSSAEIVSSIPDDRIRLITKINGGPSSARNSGIEAAKGDYIAFIDADDIWSPDYLKEMTELIADFPDAVIWGFNYSMIQDGETKHSDVVSYRGYVSEQWDSFPFFFSSSSSCCRRSTLIELGGFDERMVYGEDIDMWFRLLLNGKGVIDSRVLAFYYKDGGDSLTQHKMPLEKHIPFFIDKYSDARKSDPCFRRFFDEQMVYRLYPYLFEKENKKTARRLAEELDYSLLKRSMRFRMKHPYAYRLLRSMKESFGSR